MTKADAAEFVAELKLKYPSPRSASSRLGGYCVGGALCLFRGHADFPFPQKWKVARVLAEMTGRREDDLQIEKAAGQILDANDKENFVVAWIVLEDALVTEEVKDGAE